jgi:hypothetical protein
MRLCCVRCTIVCDWNPRALPLQCALSIQSTLHAAKLEEGVSLSVKLGIGVGRISVLHLGGIFHRMEYVAVGEPLVQAFAAEHHAEAGGEVRAAACVGLCSVPEWLASA